MNMRNPWQEDIDAVLAHRRDNGADDFATPDGRLLKGAPFTALESAMYLLELGVPPEHEVLQSIAGRIISGCREDGRIRIAPSGAIYPCQTALALNVLCHMGYDNAYTRRAFAYFLNAQEADGGWKCNKYSFGRGEETECSTPYTTLVALDAFRVRMNGWIGRRPFCCAIGTFAGPSAHAITVSAAGLCRWSIPFGATICSIIFMCFRFTKAPCATAVFWRLCQRWNRAWRTGKSLCNARRQSLRALAFAKRASPACWPPGVMRSLNPACAHRRTASVRY